MIVARDTAVGDLIGEFVAAAGHQAVYATDDEGVTQRLRHTGATIALVDIEHMDTDEVEVARTLRSAGVPVIAFSGRLFDDELQAIAGSSASATFALPATARMLAQQLRALDYVHGAPTENQPPATDIPGRPHTDEARGED
jgi:DNA-binding response OmpR family regulator